MNGFPLLLEKGSKSLTGPVTCHRILFPSLSNSFIPQHPTPAMGAPPVTQTCGAHPALPSQVLPPVLNTRHPPPLIRFQLISHQSGKLFWTHPTPFPSSSIVTLYTVFFSFSRAIPRQESNICWWIYFIKHHHPHYTELIFQFKVEFMSNNILIHKLHIFSQNLSLKSESLSESPENGCHFI